MESFVDCFPHFYYLYSFIASGAMHKSAAIAIMPTINSVLFNTALLHSTWYSVSDNDHITGGECYCSTHVCCVEIVKKRN